MLRPICERPGLTGEDGMSVWRGTGPFVSAQDVEDLVAYLGEPHLTSPRPQGPKDSFCKIGDWSTQRFKRGGPECSRGLIEQDARDDGATEGAYSLSIANADGRVDKEGDANDEITAAET